MKILLLLLIWVKLKNAACFETNADTDDFETLLLQNDAFVDKSLLINEFLSSKSPLTLIVRPPGWGKSINLDMLRRFFRPEVDQNGKLLTKGKTTNGKLFLGGRIEFGPNRAKLLSILEIAHLTNATLRMGMNPVILLKLKNTMGTTYQQIVQGVQNQIKEAFEDHRYLANSLKVTLGQELAKYLGDEEIQEHDLSNSLYFLSWKLMEHFDQKVIVLIDDYDAPIINTYLRFGAKSEEFRKISQLVKNLYQITLNSNPNILKGVLCGTLKISLNDEKTSTTNKLDINTLVHPKFSNFFGFTEPEVNKLLVKAPSELNRTSGEMRIWYGGYNYDHAKNTYYYNSRSVMQCLGHDGVLGYYAKDTNKSTGLVDKLLSDDNLQPRIQKLISGEGVKYSTFSYTLPINWERISILEILLLNGYFCMRDVPFEEMSQFLAIPNKEMNLFFATKVLEWVSTKLDIKIEEFYSLAEALKVGNITEFEKMLQTHLSKAGPYLETLEDQAQLFYVGFMIALQRALADTHVTRVGQKEGDISTADEILLIPKPGLSDIAIAINYKRIEKAFETMLIGCIAEIASGRYEDTLKSRDHVKKFIKLGLAFRRGEVWVKYESVDL